MPKSGPERGLERSWIEPIVARVVGEVLESHAGELREEIVRRVVEEIAAESATAAPKSSSVTSTSGPAELARAVAEIQLGSSQREILRALLDASSHYAARVALFVVKGSHATGWQGRGFANSDAVKDFALDENAPAVTHAIGDRVVASAPVADWDSHFLQQFGSPASGEGRVLPLILKDKVAALVYADSGTDAGGLFDAGALELLVLSTSAWLEVNSLRKQAQKEPTATHAEMQSASTAVAVPASHATPAFNDPFAAHAPAFTSHAMAAAAGEASAGTASESMHVEGTINRSATAVAHSAAVEEQSAVVEMEPAFAAAHPIGHADAKAVAQTAAAPAISPEDEETHRKAQRFARLLVDEIKLYNQAKVAEGRKKKDLYDRLKEAVEKSRATYQKRYGNTVAAAGNYFHHEIIRSLAEDDVSIMGPNFR
jgi:hypothetical protein